MTVFYDYYSDMHTVIWIDVDSFLYWTDCFVRRLIRICGSIHVHQEKFTERELERKRDSEQVSYEFLHCDASDIHLLRTECHKIIDDDMPHMILQVRRKFTQSVS